MSFDESTRGATTTVNVVSDTRCPDCFGSGAAPGTTPRPCPDCGGRGVIEDNQGFFSFSQPCTRCGGRGRIIDQPCPTCPGGGSVRRPRQVKVRIPQGVRDGQRDPGQGPRRQRAPTAAPTATCTCGSRSSPTRCSDATGTTSPSTVPITFAEAALGADIKVPTLDGDPVTIRVPSGTPSGKTFRVRGRGVQTQRSRGDLLVTVVIDVPLEPTEAERTALEALAQASSESPRAHLGVLTMPEFHQAVYVISVAAELAGVHPQTLRIYERKGLLDPGRTQGGSRRYSEADIELLRRIQALTTDGLNLAGVKRVLELEAEVERLRRRVDGAVRPSSNRPTANTAVSSCH